MEATTCETFLQKIGVPLKLVRGPGTKEGVNYPFKITKVDADREELPVYGSVVRSIRWDFSMYETYLKLTTCYNVCTYLHPTTCDNKVIDVLLLKC